MARVLHLIDHNGLGGAQRLVFGIARQQPEHQVIPLRFKPGQPWQPNGVSMNTTTVPITRRVTPLAQCISVLQIKRQMQKQPPECLHCHLSASWLAGIWLHQRYPNTPCIFHEHNPYILFSRYYPWLVRSAARHGRLIAVSSHIASAFIQNGVPASNIHVLPNFIDPHFFEAPLGNGEKPSQPVDGVFKIGFAGRLIASKGWQAILSIADKLRDQPIKIILAGKGKDEHRIHKTIQAMELQAKVSLAGYIQDMRQFYRSLDLFLFPSQYEIFGLAPLEAQACGTPVAAFSIPGLSEAISTENALLSPPADTQSLSNQIREYIQNPGLRAHLSQCGQVNARRFSIDTYLVKLESIYQLILNN